MPMLSITRIAIIALVLGIFGLLVLYTYEVLKPPPPTPQQLYHSLEERAKHGDPKAQSELCLTSTYDDQFGYKMQACKHAAEHGDERAMRELVAATASIDHKADCDPDYFRELVVNPADQGDLKSQYRRGLAYYFGGRCSTGRQSYEEAYFWLALASRRGPPPVRDGTDYSFWRDSAAKHLTFDQKTYADKRVEEWKPNSVRDTKDEAVQVEASRAKAKELEKIAALRSDAAKGNTKAQVALGEIYDGRQFFPTPAIAPDYAEALKWYGMAAEQGDIEAQNALAWMYHFGHGTMQNDAEAMRWFSKAALQGDAEAAASIGQMYMQGWGVKQDSSEAVKWYRMSAEHGNMQVCVELGDIYEFGRGVKQDYIEAQAWYALGGLGWKALELSKKMTPEDNAEARRLAVEWRSLHPKPPPAH